LQDGGTLFLLMLWGPETKLRDPECVELRVRILWRGERCKFIFNFINSFVGYNPNTDTYKGLVLRPSCVPEKVGINKKLNFH